MNIRTGVKFALGVPAVALAMGFSVNAAAAQFYEFSSYAGTGSEYDVASYGNSIYYGAGTSVYSIDVAIADMSKRDEPSYLTDGSTANPNYQTRTFSNEQSYTLSGAPGYLNGGSVGEMWVDANSIYTTAGDKVYAFDKTSGAYQSTVVTGGGIVGNYAGNAHFLSYGDGKWWAGNEDRQVWSSTGGSWSFEFGWPDMVGGHGDGMEWVNGSVWVSDMTSNYLARWGDGDNPETGAVETGWNEWNRFDYTEELDGTNKVVEGMGFGALGHFWAGAGTSVYEIGGGDIGQYTDNGHSVPEPGTLLLLGAGLFGLAGFRRKEPRQTI